MTEIETEARTERHCPDPACKWKFVEPIHQADEPLPWAPWSGSIEATINNSVEQIVVDHYRIVEAACDAHVREVHDAVDPIGWATRTVEALAAAQKEPDVTDC